MRVQQKPFYADLFSKTSPTVLPAIPSLKVAPSPAPVSARPPEDEVKNTRTAPGKEIVLSGKGRALAPLDKTPDSKTDGVALSDPAPENLLRCGASSAMSTPTTCRPGK